MKRTLTLAVAAIFLSMPTMIAAQDAAKVQPQSYRVALDNPRVRVLEFRARPGMGVCGVGMHSHPAHLTVLLTPQTVRIRLPDGRTIVKSGKTGDTFWEPPVTHDVENVSGYEARSLIIEVKSPGGGGR